MWMFVYRFVLLVWVVRWIVRLYMWIPTWWSVACILRYIEFGRTAFRALAKWRFCIILIICVLWAIWWL